jgi:hypothetical protein
MKRKYSTYAIQRRATRLAQDKADDAFYAEQARNRREAEAKEAAANTDESNGASLTPDKE